MTLSDYMEEMNNDSNNLFVVFVVPSVCVVLYIIFRRWIYDNQMVRLKDVVIIVRDVADLWTDTGILIVLG